MVNSKCNKGEYNSVNYRLCGYSFFAIYLYKYYTMNVRTGKLVDAIFSLLLAGISSNIFIDQALLGYIRDYIINPIAISNLSDIYVNLMVVLIVIESIILHRNKKTGKLKEKEIA